MSLPWPFNWSSFSSLAFNWHVIFRMLPHRPEAPSPVTSLRLSELCAYSYTFIWGCPPDCVELLLVLIWRSLFMSWLVVIRPGVNTVPPGWLFVVRKKLFIQLYPLILLDESERLLLKLIFRCHLSSMPTWYILRGAHACVCIYIHD